jgi:ubiquinone/menaquinone biosynthesis C-methylase UbiE
MMSARKLSPQIDPDLIKSWIDICDNHHDERCTSKSRAGRVDSLGDGFHLIDIANRRVVRGCDLPGQPQYLALSYVWGGVEQLSLRGDTIERLFCSGGLDDSFTDIPATIKDAMRFCGLIGKQYLWIDALCILQDDKTSRLQQITVMDSIYHSALLTIVVS